MSYIKVAKIPINSVFTPERGHIYFGADENGELWIKTDNNSQEAQYLKNILSGGTSGGGGTNGTSGSSGSSGSSGVNGTFFGSSGSSGLSGTNGTSGSSGDIGLSGTNGTSGSSGDKGEKGDPGASIPYIRAIDPIFGYLENTISVSGHSFTSDGVVEIGNVVQTDVTSYTSEYFEVKILGSNVFYPDIAQLKYTNYTGSTSTPFTLYNHPYNTPIITGVANDGVLHPIYAGLPMGNSGDTIIFSGINFTTVGNQIATFGDFDVTIDTENKTPTTCTAVADGKYFGMVGVSISNISGYTSNRNFILFNQNGPMPNITSVTNLTTNSYFGGVAGLNGWGFLNMYTPLWSGTTTYQGDTHVYLKSSSGNLTLVSSITNIVQSGNTPWTLPPTQQYCDCVFSIPQNFPTGEYDMLLVTDYGLDTWGEKFVVYYYAPSLSAATITNIYPINASQGEIVSVSGTNFNSMEGLTDIFFATGTPSGSTISGLTMFKSTDVQVISSTFLECTVPAVSYIGNAYVAVTNGVRETYPEFNGTKGFFKYIYFFGSGVTMPSMPGYLPSSGNITLGSGSRFLMPQDSLILFDSVGVRHKLNVSTSGILVITTDDA